MAAPTPELSPLNASPRQPVDFALRDYRADDAAAVDAVVLAAFAEYRDAYSDWPAFARGLGQMVALAPSSEIVVAERGGSLCGAVAYVPAGRPKRAFFRDEWPIMRMLVVAPGSRGLGIGRALAAECIRRAERDRAPLIALHSSPLMRVALPMYERLGFRYECAAPPIHGVAYAIYLKRLGDGPPAS